MQTVSLRPEGSTGVITAEIDEKKVVLRIDGDCELEMSRREFRTFVHDCGETSDASDA